MPRHVTVQEASLALGLSPDTIKRKLRAGVMPGCKEPMEKGERWLVELGDDVVIPETRQDTALSDATAKVIANLERERDELWSEVAARRREVEELHILLSRANEGMRALAEAGQRQDSASASEGRQAGQPLHTQSDAARTPERAAKLPFWKRLFAS
jgi:hypothetical protein